MIGLIDNRRPSFFLLYRTFFHLQPSFFSFNSAPGDCTDVIDFLEITSCFYDGVFV